MNISGANSPSFKAVYIKYEDYPKKFEDKCNMYAKINRAVDKDSYHEYGYIKPNGIDKAVVWLKTKLGQDPSSYMIKKNNYKADTVIIADSYDIDAPERKEIDTKISEVLACLGIKYEIIDDKSIEG